MFVWAWAVFKLDFFSHLPGFAVMGLSTAFAVAAFGMLLASACHTRAQLGALSTLLILMMSAIGGSMFPRFLMPDAIQKAGLFTINAWAIDGFTKVFWRDLPVEDLWSRYAFCWRLAWCCLWWRGEWRGGGRWREAAGLAELAELAELGFPS